MICLRRNASRSVTYGDVAHPRSRARVAATGSLDSTIRDRRKSILLGRVARPFVSDSFGARLSADATRREPRHDARDSRHHNDEKRHRPRRWLRRHQEDDSEKESETNHIRHAETSLHGQELGGAEALAG